MEKQEETQSISRTRRRPGAEPHREGECSEMKPQKEATARPADPCTCHSSEGFLSFGFFFFFLYPLTPEPSVLRVPSSLDLTQHCTLSSCILKSSLTLLPPHENTQAFILGQLATTLIVESLSLPAISSVSITLLLFQCECLFFPLLAQIYAQILPLLLLHKYLARALCVILPKDFRH